MKTEANDLINPVKEAAENMYAFKTVGGLTKREYFAAMAMIGLCIDNTMFDFKSIQSIAYNAVALAGELINELNAEESK